MIKNISILFGILALIAGYTWYGDYAHKPSMDVKENPSQAALLQQAPDFEFVDLNGKKHALADFKDKTIVLNFWASWCAPCVIELPQMLQLAKDTKEKTAFIFLSIDDSKEEIIQFLQKHKMDIKASNVFVAWDEDRFVSRELFQTEKIPETFIIAPDLMIREKIIGNSVEWNGQEMVQKLMGNTVN